MSADLGHYVGVHSTAGRLVVQPRMGMADPEAMAAGIAAVAGLDCPTVATVTIDSYTRVGDHAAATRALRSGAALNGFPIVSHGPERTALVAAAAGDDVPVQVRHGSARPGAILAAAAEAGLSASEGGPVSYCLPYGRTPLVESVSQWADATAMFGELVSDRGGRAHLETFGGCLLGQLCPPSLLIATSVLEALFFVQHGLRSVSLSYAQQTHPVQDIEALAALDQLASELLPNDVDRHIVLYTYMGVFPRRVAGARSLLADSARIAVLGGAQRLIVKTETEAHRIPTVAENLAALTAAADWAAHARRDTDLPDRHAVDFSQVLDEARTLVQAVLALSPDVGRALVQAFASGTLDVPYCLHADNAGQSRGAIDADGRLYWAHAGRMPVRIAAGRPATAVTSGGLLRMLNHTAERHDRAALTPSAGTEGVADLDRVRALRDRESASDPVRIAVVGSGPRGLSVLERLAARADQAPDAPAAEVWLIDDVEVGCGRIWRTDQSTWLLMNTAASEVTMFSGPPDDGPARAGAGPSLGQWWADVAPEDADPDGYAPRAVYGRYLRFVLDVVERTAPDRVRVHRVLGRVVDVVNTGARHRSTPVSVRLEDGRHLKVDRAVLTTGHQICEPPAEQRRLEAFAARRRNAQYISGDSRADLPLDTIPAGVAVGVIGLGLSFYDIMAQLTLGRGGRFVDDGDGRLRYLPSGREPLMVAGSRGGLPLPARGRNQKRPDHTYRPRILTVERIGQRRARGPLDFRTCVLPFLLAEIDLVYCETVARMRGVPDVPDVLDLPDLLSDVDQLGPRRALARLRERLGLTDLPALDLEALARPFVDREFASPQEYQAAVRNWIDDDLAAAAQGNADGPLKAALDVIRDVRGVLR